jgi:hypothetical protein
LLATLRSSPCRTIEGSPVCGKRQLRRPASAGRRGRRTPVVLAVCGGNR